MRVPAALGELVVVVGRLDPAQQLGRSELEVELLETATVSRVGLSPRATRFATNCTTGS